MKKKKCDLLRELIKHQRKSYAFTDSLPNSVKFAFWDNEAADAQAFMIEKLINAYFKDEAETVNYILYDAIDKPVRYWDADGTEYNFATVEEYVDYLEEF